jgi:ABC-type dipeptide/oligopeptide/nickel transport system permease subunit
VIGGFASLTILTKNSFLDEIRKQYVVTARAKGLGEQRVLYGHVFRNAMLIVIAGFPAAFIGMLFTGALLIEVIFSLDGLGLLGFEAALNRDYPGDVRHALLLYAGGPVAPVGDLTSTCSSTRIDFRILRGLSVCALLDAGSRTAALVELSPESAGASGLAVDFLALFFVTLPAELLANDAPAGALRTEASTSGRALHPEKLRSSRRPIHRSGSRRADRGRAGSSGRRSGIATTRWCADLPTPAPSPPTPPELAWHDDQARDVLARLIYGLHLDSFDSR